MARRRSGSRQGAWRQGRGEREDSPLGAATDRDADLEQTARHAQPHPCRPGVQGMPGRQRTGDHIERVEGLEGLAVGAVHRLCTRRYGRPDQGRREHEGGVQAVHRPGRITPHHVGELWPGHQHSGRPGQLDAVGAQPDVQVVPDRDLEHDTPQ